MSCDTTGMGVPEELRPSQRQGYRTILADPPWDIQQKGSLGAVRHYPVMTVEAIAALEVDRLCMTMRIFGCG